MTWEGVPWAVGGTTTDPDGNVVGPEHPVEVGRLLAYHAGGGLEGVIDPTSLQVVPLEVPGAGVRIMPGAASLLNRFPGGGQQAYLVRNPDVETVPLTPTGSSGGRHDLIAVVVEDPQYPGQPAPADVVTGPYVRTRVFTDVPATTTMLEEVAPGQTGLALGRVQFSASDGTVELASITDLRVMPQARVGGVTRTLNVPDGTAAETLTTDAFSVFPNGASWGIVVPPWAVKASLELYASGVRVLDDSTEGGNWRGTARLLLDGGANGSVGTAGAEVNPPVSQGPGKADSVSYMAAQDVTIPRAMRGKAATIKAQALRITASGGVSLQAFAGTTVVAKVTFYEDVDDTFWVA